METTRRTRVLVVEDVPMVRKFLTYTLATDPGIEVVGAVGDGQAALDFLAHTAVDVVTMDIHMPRMDGFEATRRILERWPLPILIVTGSGTATETRGAFQAIEAGAVSVVARPLGLAEADAARSASEFVKAVKLVASVQVKTTAPPARRYQGWSPWRVVGCGASTGGPQALRTILGALPAGFGCPIVVAQHIASGFAAGLADWLDSVSNLSVALARDGERVEPGRVYIAPDDCQLGLTVDGCVALADAPPEHGLRPSAAYLFRSLAHAFGRHAIGVLLTGMGKDGAAALGQMRAAGALTIAQDEQSCVVHGMPGEAIRLGAARYVLSPSMIAELLTQVTTPAEEGATP